MVIKLFQDKDIYDRLRVNGWNFMKNTYSEKVVTNRIDKIFNSVEKYPIKRISKAGYFAGLLKQQFYLFINRDSLWWYK